MYLTEIVHETPPHCLDQKRFLDLLKALHPNSIESIDKVCCQEDKIGTRYCVADDFDQLGDFEDRGERFHTFASGVFERLYPVETPPPPDLIHVTCTGYRSPSAAQVLVTRRGWEQDTTVTHAYHMGCLAALSAIRMGRGYLASGREGVDVVHTELSSLHFNGRLATNEQFVAQSLFADGLIKYTLTSAPKGPSFRILAQEEVMIRDSDELMKWETASWGLKMTL